MEGLKDSALEAILAQLIKEGLNGVAPAFASLFELAMQIERERFLGAGHYERTAGGQFILGMQTLPGNPYDGHTLSGQIEQVERLTGITVERAYVDRGYKGHRAVFDHSGSYPHELK